MPSNEAGAGPASGRDTGTKRTTIRAVFAGDRGVDPHQSGRDSPVLGFTGLSILRTLVGAELAEAQVKRLELVRMLVEQIAQIGCRLMSSGNHPERLSGPGLTTSLLSTALGQSTRSRFGFLIDNFPYEVGLKSRLKLVMNSRVHGYPGHDQAVA